ncbi:MAG: thioredoxin domain-containing protein, partial [Nitrospirae bacterium]|nr:thioredoxin domain-containing protein [Candidatus Troglogloeales bacterium]
MSEAKGYGVTTAPTFFINGRKLVGERSVADFKQIIDEELGLTQPAQIPPSLPGVPSQSALPVSIDTKDAPSFGPQEAPIVIVEFSDFQCPFCARTVPTLQDLKKRYPTQVRLAYKHLPLDFHADSKLAH